MRLPALPGPAAALVQGRRGTTALVVAVAASSLLAMAGLATEAGGWYVVRREAQNAADAAALAAATVMSGGGGANAALSAGQAIAARNGFPAGGRTTLSIGPQPNASPPQVLVTIEQLQEPYLSRLFGLRTTVRADARAALMPSSGGGCVLALGAAVVFAGNSSIHAPDCGFVSNFADPNSFKMGSGGSDAGSSFTVRTAAMISRGGCLTCTTAQSSMKLSFTTGGPAFYQPATANRYAALENGVPTGVKTTGCASSNKLDTDPDGSTVALSPGCYNAIRVTGGKQLQLSPGTYVVSRGDFYVGGGTTVTCPNCDRNGDGTGVTIILTGNSGNPGGTLNIQANASVTLNAPRLNPDSASLNGVLFYRDSQAPDGANNGSMPVDITGGPQIHLRGAIVAPSSTAIWRGGGTTGTSITASSQCTAFVVRGMQFTGGVGLDTSGCSSTGTLLPRLQFVRLVPLS